ncbi:hypothetical protein MIND_00541200 [Mycena indigotica]|uniref:WD40 repeat-like protein n=1 Tax=Mycena indigotica TaxID=2126181 RepID=A0A8H6SWX2_9AGAR|nr:uncharacterized protein MIND_00541200 [Mycena indigotica]KAF7307468.1 hypothetical protein MIND_00541200 [Mycena indigotica]
MAETKPLIRLTADEINCLVYAFLVDSGFRHAAFNLRMEAQLENGPNFTKHIPRGELIDLLGKSLLFREVEAHWKSDNLALNCQVGFSLLEPHICSLVAPKEDDLPPSVYTQRPLLQSMHEMYGKRKGEALNGGPADKKLRRDLSDGEGKLKIKVQGPSDHETDPRAVLVLPGHSTEVFVCSFNPTKPNVLVTGSKNAVVNMWDLPFPPPASSANFSVAPAEGPHQLEHFPDVIPGDLTNIEWNHDGSLVAIGSYDTVLRIFTITGDLYMSHTQHKAPIFAARFSRTGKWLVSCSLDGTACVWDVENRELLMQYRGHQDCCLDVEWLSDEIFASCSSDKTIHILRVGQANPLAILTGHEREVNQIRVNPAGTRLISCSDDQTARVWNIEHILRQSDSNGMLEDTPEPIVLSGHTNSIQLIAWCCNLEAGPNEVLATGSSDGTVRFWDSITGACLHIIADHKRGVFSLRFSPDGQRLATGGGDGWLHVYDVKTRQLRWSWFAGFDKPGIFDIVWQTHPALGVDRIALGLECRQVAIVDVLKVPALQK